MWCGVVRRGAARRSAGQCSAVRSNVAQRSAVRCSVVRCGAVQCGAVRWDGMQCSILSWTPMCEHRGCLLLDQYAPEHWAVQSYILRHCTMRQPTVVLSCATLFPNTSVAIYCATHARTHGFATLHQTSASLQQTTGTLHQTQATLHQTTTTLHQTHPSTCICLAREHGFTTTCDALPGVSANACVSCHPSHRGRGLPKNGMSHGKPR